MTKYSKYNVIYRLQKWMDSVSGQTFMNYAYSWGASVVILGTLFKLTHLPGANLMLFVGMGTEVVVFFISAFDRPFDKTQDGMELETSRTRKAAEGGEAEGEGAETVIAGGGTVIAGGGVIGGGVIGGGTVIAGEGGGVPSGEGASGEGGTGGGTFVIGGINGPTTPAPAVTQETAEAMEEATTTYVSRLNELNELLLKVAAQSERLTTDSEEMENLNRTLTGIAKVYEMQLKGASQQIGTIDEINSKTRRMVEQIEALNQVYARMIEAMTMNMPGAAKG
ncbi:MAG: gliding motility protein GldL [Prevotella sp.]|nr:gliding motility protein GldL [Prevotella sp.]